MCCYVRSKSSCKKRPTHCYWPNMKIESEGSCVVRGRGWYSIIHLRLSNICWERIII
ncbi:MAG: hypothetical protein SOZ94_08775 [Prevotella sp.]|nr:hypothetical protein [Prevotella sp.]